MDVETAKIYADVKLSEENDALIAENEILRAALKLCTAANGEKLPVGSSGTTIINDGRLT